MKKMLAVLFIFGFMSFSTSIGIAEKNAIQVEQVELFSISSNFP